jgi:hypothetical protein
MHTAGKELTVKRADEPEDSAAGRRARVWRRRLGAGEWPQVGRKRALVAVLREAIVDGTLGAEHPSLDCNAEPGTADGVPLNAVAGKLEVKSPPSCWAPPRELEAEDPEVAIAGDDVSCNEVAVGAEQDDPDSPTRSFTRRVRRNREVVVRDEPVPTNDCAAADRRRRDRWHRSAVRARIAGAELRRRWIALRGVEADTDGVLPEERVLQDQVAA